MAKSQGAGQVSTAAKAEKTITKMSAIMVSCFLIAWTPYAIMAMGATYGSPEVFTSSTAALPALFAKASNCYNPIIYVFMNKQVGVCSSFSFEFSWLNLYPGLSIKL